ncbi:hypothetical protein L3i20_v231250 [Paenibacillus sp. L3-i20]|nr:hypothetical protein L3i20_v231250 [Paenibacillus sp. L3-i20]
MFDSNVLLIILYFVEIIIILGNYATLKKWSTSFYLWTKIHRREVMA